MILFVVSGRNNKYCIAFGDNLYAIIVQYLGNIKYFKKLIYISYFREAD
jgi:hypothetical protein